ncbi:serine hydrolase domain-containing protein [Paenibacillus filicis]|uniref:Serine hydrolase domain-containing protein n=1 Tax=Paenibacillus filicis TaxID=669464 RepID=A0ABU9DCS9_9BACL
MEQLEHTLQLWIRKYFKHLPNAAVAVGVTGPEGRKVWTVNGTGISQSPGENFRFEIGSITKVFVASLLAVLVEEGRLKLTDTVADHVPEVNKHSPAAGVTLQQLSTHTSGLPRLPPNLKATMTDKMNPYSDFTERDLLEALNSGRKLYGSSYSYSNYGFGLLGYIVARTAGLPLVEAIRERITAQLGMAKTGTEESFLHPVYSASGKPVKHWDMDALAGAGALRSTAGDLLLFLEANMGSDPAAEPLTSAFRLCHAEHPSSLIGMKIGLGWMNQTLENGRTILWHNGATYGSHSFLAFDPDTRTGVAVLVNHGVSLWRMLGFSKLPADQIGRSVLLDMGTEALS